MARKRYKPPVRAICKLGTLAHNQQFTARDLRQYTGASAEPMLRWLKRHKLITAESAGRSRKFYPTKKGWTMIEKACKR